MAFLLSQEQQRILQVFLDWFASEERAPLTLGGYAGTGKTTLLTFFRRLLRKENAELSVAFCAFTGKAATVLKTRLFAHKALYRNDFVGTMHSLMYSAITDKKSGAVIGWEKKSRDELPFDLIVVDEASMVSRTLWQDILSYDIPVIAVGDHGQLPPINDDFNLMSEPQLRLETIHRQAADNPIIQLSIQAREEGHIPYGEFGAGVKKLSRQDSESSSVAYELFQGFDEDTLVLVGYNKSRHRLNQEIRANLDFYEPTPQAGDRVICLKNNRSKNIYNGLQGVIHTISPFDAETDPDWYYADIEMDGGYSYFSGAIAREQFGYEQGILTPPPLSTGEKGDFFDFGYAITVHKAQGAQARRVILFEERFAKMDDDQWCRWLYTGITRAEEELYVFAQ